VLIDGGFSRADVVGAQGTRSGPHGAPFLVDVMSALGWQPRSKGLSRDAGDVTATGRGTGQRRRLPGRVGVGQERLQAARPGYPVRVPPQEALSLDALAVKSRYPQTRMSPHESVRVRGVHDCAHKLHTVLTGQLSSATKSPGQKMCPRQVSNLRPAA
jgi:hypothetical protein